MTKRSSGRTSVTAPLAAAMFLLLAAAPAATGQGAEAVTWARANNCASIRAYLAQYPSGRYVSEARAALRAKSCPDPEAEARRRAEREAAERVRLENETRDLRDRLAREEAARRAAETRASDEARKRVAAETAANAAKQKATVPPPVATSQPVAYDLNLLHPDVRRAAEAARAAQTRANSAAALGRSAASGGRSSGAVNPREGLGTYVQGSGVYQGDTHAGTYSQSKYNGPGVYTWAVNTNNVNRLDRFEGDFVDSKARGYGVSYWHSGQRRAGEMRDWFTVGYAVHTWPDGQRYEGQWGGSNFRYNGYGVVWNGQGRVSQAGYWTDGTLTTSLTR